MKTDAPIFYKGQAVICIDNSWIGNQGSKNPLIEGNKYHIDDPDFHRNELGIYVSIVGFYNKGFKQICFVPEDFDKHATELMQEALEQSETLTQ